MTTFHRSSDYRLGVDWIIVLASVLHLVWGGILLASTSSYAVTSISGIRLVFAHVSQGTLAGLMVVVALLAIVSMRGPKTVWSVVFLMPQEAFLVMSATSAMLAIVHGTYADAVVRPRLFLAADQAIYILLALLYPCAIWKAYIWDVFRDARAMEPSRDVH